MQEQKKNIFESLKNVQILQNFLESEMHIEEGDDGVIKVGIRVFNAGPSDYYGGEVVFTGVGLRIIDGREENKVRAPKVNKARSSDNLELRHKYDEGVWIGGIGNSFPIVTADEQSHGEVLFPGECVEYEIKTSKEELPYLEIRVDGSVSRRHLLHFSRPMEGLKHWSQPLVIETFRDVDKIDFFAPILAMANSLPAMGPQTTFADMDNLKMEIERVRSHLKTVMTEVNKVYHSAPNQRLRDYMKQGIGLYIKSVGMAFDSTQKALSSGDMGKMKQAVDEMKEKLLKTDEVKRQRAELIAEFGIDT